MFNSLKALFNGLIKDCSKKSLCLLPSLPLPIKLYNKPTKSSCDGGIKNLNLPLLSPRFLALTAENLFLDSIPVTFSSILLNI